MGTLCEGIMSGVAGPEEKAPRQQFWGEATAPWLSHTHFPVSWLLFLLLVGFGLGGKAGGINGLHLSLCSGVIMWRLSLGQATCKANALTPRLVTRFSLFGSLLSLQWLPHLRHQSLTLRVMSE